MKQSHAQMFFEASNAFAHGGRGYALEPSSRDETPRLGDLYKGLHPIQIVHFRESIKQPMSVKKSSNVIAAEWCKAARRTSSDCPILRTAGYPDSGGEMIVQSPIRRSKNDSPHWHMDNARE